MQKNLTEVKVKHDTILLPGAGPSRKFLTWLLFNLMQSLLGEKKPNNCVSTAKLYKR